MMENPSTELLRLSPVTIRSRVPAIHSQLIHSLPSAMNKENKNRIKLDYRYKKKRFPCIRRKMYNVKENIKYYKKEKKNEQKKFSI